MKIEKRVIEKEVYIAADGSEFDDKELCERYEDGAMLTWANDHLRSLPSFSADPPACDYYADYSWVRLDSNEDLVALKYAEFQPDSIAHDYTVPCYPCWVLYHVDDNGDGYISGTVDELEEDFAKYIRMVRKEIAEKNECIERDGWV